MSSISRPDAEASVVRRRGRRSPNVTLTDQERQALHTWSCDPHGPTQLRTRARVLLACAEGRSNAEIAMALGLARTTVAAWRHRFLEARLAGLRRPQPAERLTERQVAEIVVATIDALPPGARWSRATMARQFNVSSSTVARVWREHGLTPHLDEASDVSMTNDRLVDVVGLYLCPPARAVALCLEPRSQARGIDWSAPLTHLGPADDPDPRGVAAILRGITRVMQGSHVGRDRRRTFRRFVSLVDSSMPARYTIRVLCSGFGREPLERMAPRTARLRVEPITSASRWTSQLGRWLLIRARQDGSSGAPDDLQVQINAWADDANLARSALVWVKAGFDAGSGLSGPIADDVC